ncbi:GNAT family N-acetyltransferase [Nonomuraea endophytica]|uniref:GNAT family N-acetyltransferase n=1 Tax=Nonomuraea endophytica TaxID=714136 RepID=UPI0016104FA0|nr:GNAT family N-acetyltransferase [Nonomuraea endophytica]
MEADVTVRPATRADIPELVRLREVLADRMAEDAGAPADDDWQEPYAKSLHERLGDPDVAVLVIDGDDGLAACGIGFIFQRFPGPGRWDGRFGYILGMATDPRHRRQGHGRAIMDALMSWYRDNDITRVDLHATSDGEPLYRSMGFTQPYPALTWLA